MVNYMRNWEISSR